MKKESEAQPMQTNPEAAAGAKADSPTLADGSETLADSVRKREVSDALEAVQVPPRIPRIPDHELLIRIGQGSYGEV